MVDNRIVIGWKEGGYPRFVPWPEVLAVRWIRQPGSQPCLLQIHAESGQIALATKLLNRSFFDAGALPDPEVLQQTDWKRAEERFKKSRRLEEFQFFDPDVGVDHGDWISFPTPEATKGMAKLATEGGRKRGLLERKVEQLRGILAKGFDLRFNYRGKEDPATIPRQVSPTRLTVRGRSPFLWAFCHTDQANRLYRVQKMTKIKVAE